MDSKNRVKRESNCDWVFRSRYKNEFKHSPGNGSIRIIVIKRDYCFVFCTLLLITKHTIYCVNLLNYWLLSNNFHVMYR